MGVTVTRNFGPLDEIVPVTKEDWGQIGRLARERVITRTLQGRDEDDRPFAAYTDAYAALKAREGASSGPNLQLSGAMLQAIQVEPDDEGVTLAIR